MIQAKKHIRDLYRTTPPSRRGYLCLDMNEGMPGLPKEFVKKALSGIAPEFLSLYPEYQTLKRTISRHNGIKPENICLANGSDNAIKHIFETYISPGDKVLLTDPTFAMYPVYCAMFSARPVTVEYKKDFSFPKDEFLKKISSGIKMAVVVNPNNPTGTALTRLELMPIIKKAYEKKVLLVVDEAYFYFYPATVIDLIKKYDNLLVLRTFSKLCGLAGMRVGYVASSPTVINNLRKVRPTYDVNGIAALLAEKLLEDKFIIPGLIKDILKGKEYLSRRLSENGIEHKKGHANFILIKCGGKSGKIKDELGRRNILVHGGFTQPFLKDYIRVTVSNEKIMRTFFKHFIDIWKNNKGITA